MPSASTVAASPVDDTIGFVWEQDVPSGVNLIYQYRDGATGRMSAPALISAGQSGSQYLPNMCIDASGKAHVVYYSGAADTVVSPANGRAAVLSWAHAAGARARPARILQRGKRYPMTVTDYQRADGSAVATLVEVARLGHAWSGGAAGQPFCDPLGPDASRLVWAFAARQFRA